MKKSGILLKCTDIKNGLIGVIGAREFAVFMLIACFCDEFNESTVSQRQIAELIGVSLPTVNKAITKLINTEIDGVPIIKRRLSNSGLRKTFSVYILNTKIIKVI